MYQFPSVIGLGAVPRGFRCGKNTLWQPGKALRSEDQAWELGAARAERKDTS